jgi:hypothetical protein
MTNEHIQKFHVVHRPTKPAPTAESILVRPLMNAPDPRMQLQGLGRMHFPDMGHLLPHGQELPDDSPTVMQGRFDHVSLLVEHLNLNARELGDRYGIHGEDLPVKEPPDLDAGSEHLQNIRAMGDVFRMIFLPQESFQLTRVGDAGWGVFYKYRPSVLGPTQALRNEMHPITSVRIDVKRAFLRRSHAFFQSYLEQVQATVGKVDADIAMGQEVARQLRMIM